MAHDVKVLGELSGVPPAIIKFGSKVFINKSPFSIDGETVIWKNERSEKLTELGELYYGKIDTEIAKKIMSTSPLPKLTTDCKITSTKLMENMGLLAFMGKSNGVTWVPTDENNNEFHGVTILPPSGWVEVYPSNSKIGNLPPTNGINGPMPVMQDLISLGNDREKSTKTLWKYDTIDDENINYSSSVVADDVVYTASASGNIYALDSNNGRQKWEINLADNTLEPALSKDIVFIGTDKGLHAIDKETGSVIWDQLVGRISSKPVISGDNVIIGCYNGEMYVFDVNHGDLKWSYALSDSAYVSELNDNNLFYIASGKTCYAFDINKKEKIWDFETNGLITSSPRKKGNTVYFGSWDGKLYALDATNGKEKWSYETGWGIDSTPDVSDETVFVGSLDNNFYALDVETGDLKWYYTCKSAIHSNPVAYGEYVFFGCDDGRFYALNQEDGTLAWSFTPGYYITDEDVNNYITTPILSSPYVEDGIVYFGAKGTIYTLDAQTFEEIKKLSEKPFKIDQGLLLLIIGLVIIILIILMLIYPKKKNGVHKK
jgi:outer membrane protein assembly factor BamB